MTLLEIMIVIFIIGIIGSVMGYKMGGSIDEGRAFKTKQSSRKIYEVLNLELAKGSTIEPDHDGLKAALKNSNLVRNPSVLLKDGWGKPFDFEFDRLEKGEVRFTSEKFHAYCEKKGVDEIYPWQEDDED